MIGNGRNPKHIHKSPFLPLYIFLILLAGILACALVRPSTAVATDLVVTEENSAASEDLEASSNEANVASSNALANNPDSQSLSRKLETSDGATYVITVSYDEAAGIPEGTELAVQEEKTTDEREKALRTTLALEDGDRIMSKTFFSITLVNDGKEVEPQAPVQVRVLTGSVDATASDAVEMALLNEGAAARLAVQNLTGQDGQGKESGSLLATDVAASTEALGQFGFATVAEQKFSWRMRGDEIAVWGPRTLEATPYEKQYDQDLGNNLRLVQAFGVKTNATHAWAPLLWATSTHDPEAESYELGGFSCYDIKSSTTPHTVFGTGETSGLAKLPSDGVYALLWQDGARTTDNETYAVSVHADETSGLPRDTEVVVNNLAEQGGDYEDYIAQSAELLGLDREALSYAKVIDISLLDGKDGEACEPQDSVRVRVDMLDASLPEDANVRVVHFGDKAEVLDAATENNSVEFSTTGFSVYTLLSDAAAEGEGETLTTQADEGATQLTAQAELPTTTTFYSRDPNPNNSNVYRTTRVRFVDQFENPVNAVVDATRDLAYRGDPLNLEEAYNTSILDPSIAGDYDFDRVFIRLSDDKNFDKNFKRIYFGRAGEINTTPTQTGDYRVYVFNESIDEAKAGGAFNGTWYSFSSGTGSTDDVYIVFNHVQNVSFHKYDAHGNPVEGAEFTVYTDETCLTELEYNGRVVKATSDVDGLVDLGRIPYRPDEPYYMKETKVPDGYKRTGKSYAFTVDGTKNPIADVKNADDDGSMILESVDSITFTKEWSVGSGNHNNDEVTIQVTEPNNNNNVAGEVTLRKSNNWKASITNLDPTVTYTATETKVTSSNEDVTNEWMPQFNITSQDTTAYYKATSFHKGQTYVLKLNGNEALARSGTNGLTTSSVSTNGNRVSSGVSNDMLWFVESVSDDGVIVLRNVGNNRWLNYGSDAWKLTSSESQFVRFKVNSNNKTYKLYYRENRNYADAYYLQKTNRGIKSTDDVNNATNFTLYRKITVRELSATVTNNPTTYPIRIKKVNYRNPSTPVAGATFDLYKEHSGTAAEKLYGDLTSEDDGTIQFDLEVNELNAGTYYLVETTTPEGYAEPAKNLRFTVTRGGQLVMENSDKEFPSFTYISTVTEDGTTYPLLQIPNKYGGVDIGLKKIDGFGAALKDATFAVYTDYECTNVVELTVNDGYVESVTSSDTFDETTGYNVSFKVPEGTYYMKETAAPEGYAQNTAVYQLVVAGEGEFTIKRMSDSSTVEETPDIAKYGLINATSTTRSVILKKIESAEYAPLEGAVFEVLRYDRTLVSVNGTTSFTSGSDGIYFVSRLPLGTYYLHETTVPSGYSSISSAEGNWYSITVSSDGVSAPTRLTKAP